MTDEKGSTSNHEHEGTFIDFNTVEMPTFNETDPEFWFIQLENQFELAGIRTDKMKFGHTLVQLDTAQFRTVLDIVKAPPEGNSFETLKAALIERLGLSKSQLIRQFLQHVRAGTEVPKELICAIWKDGVPDWVQCLLDDQDSVPLETADKIHKDTPSGSQDLSFHLENLQANITDISNKMDALITKWDQERRQQFHSTSRDRRLPARGCRSQEWHQNRDARVSDSKMDHKSVCWYHRKFGRLARQCHNPCIFH